MRRERQMTKVVTLLCGSLLIGGCHGQGSPMGGCAPGTAATAFASFQPMRNKRLSGHIHSTGPLDEVIEIEGVADSPFELTVGVSWKEEDASSSSSAEVGLLWRDNRLSFWPEDGRLAGGGERPAVRRENDGEVAIYYPMELRGKRTWAKFRILVMGDLNQRATTRDAGRVD